MSAKRNRTIIEISGEETLKFLQGLITNDIDKLDKGIIYAAMLTPQGKYFVDFFIVAYKGRILIDVSKEVSDDLQTKLLLYRLRTKVDIIKTNISVSTGIDNPPLGAFNDPRHAALGWRSYETSSINQDIDWKKLRVKHGIPETNIELIRDKTYILEASFEKLNGVDFKKGCYVGQEITARMKHKTTLKKGLIKVSVIGETPVGTEILADGRPAGVLYSQSDGHGLAFLKLDRAFPKMQAGEATVIIEN
jgi:folate-binding protein YgfZ|tara:strand:+ start:229 stop:975 length:747 start_codon:yes stop_codon:yes gene_type:complete